jgi:hypothetical protein
MLMAGHYLMAVVVALLCAGLYRNIGIDLGSFQCVSFLLPSLHAHRYQKLTSLTSCRNRLGLFFFILALFAFSSLTSLGLFANERLLFMRERFVLPPPLLYIAPFLPFPHKLTDEFVLRHRANGYYSPLAYFLSKVLFDILPLRIIPSIILGSIVYGMVGLVPNLTEFWKFLLTLVLFNLATASVVFFISVAVANTGLANLTGSLVMLYKYVSPSLRLPLMGRTEDSPTIRLLIV